MTRTACALLLLGLGCGGEDPGAAFAGPPPVTVEVVTVEPSPLHDWVDFLGQLESEASVIVKPEISGIVDTIEFVEGHPVKQGDLLVRLRNQQQLAALREAEAKAKLAKNSYQRTLKLAKQHVSAAVDLDRALAENEVSRAVVEIARVEMDRTEIRAPFDGVVGARLVSPGERVDEDTGLVQIDAIDRLQVVFAIPEIGVSIMRVGMPVTVSVAPYPGESFAGEVFFVAPALDPRTRQLALKAWIANPDQRLKPGFFVNVKIQIAERENAIMIPETAIVYDQEGPFVWRVLDGAIAERASVVIGLRQPGRVEITSGLHAGERIVSAGTHKVRHGAKLDFDRGQASSVPSNEDAT